MECSVITILTTDKLQLNGLWFGGEKSKRAFVFLHGLTSSPFSHHELLVPLANSNTAVIFFGNRGQEVVSKFHRINRLKKTGYTSCFIGEAHEVFEDCVKDIDGVVKFLKSKRVEEIILVGHSTGCQKVIYYLSRRGRQKLISSVILLAPLSDYAYAAKFEKPDVLEKAVQVAKEYVCDGNGHELLPSDVSKETMDAQRFLSLYTPDSIENNIFPYFDPKRKPKFLRSVRIPTLVVLGGKDEYRDRPIKEIANWFSKKIRRKNFEVKVIAETTHGFNGKENQLLKIVNEYLSKYP